MNRFSYRVVLKCEYGPEEGKKWLTTCEVTARNGMEARRQILHWIAEQNRPPTQLDGVELNREEVQHIHANWNRFRVLDMTPSGMPVGDLSGGIYWSNWDELPDPES